MRPNLPRPPSALVPCATLATLAALTLLAACSDVSAPLGLASTITAFRTAGPIPLPPPVVHVDADAIRVDGQLATPTPCYTLSGGASVSHDTLDVRVVAHPARKGGGPCVEMLQPWLYTVAVTGVPYGLTAIRVTHDTGIGAQSVVLEQSIVVP